VITLFSIFTGTDRRYPDPEVTINRSPQLDKIFSVPGPEPGLLPS
jgi:hypothetical protein